MVDQPVVVANKFFGFDVVLQMWRIEVRAQSVFGNLNHN